MADETYAVKKIWQIHAGKEEIAWCLLNEVIGPGDTLRLDTSLKGNATKTSDASFAGVALNQKGTQTTTDCDTDFEAGDYIAYAIAGSGIDVHVKLSGTAGPIAVMPGDILVLSATDDQVAKFAYTDAAIATDTLAYSVGRCMEYDAGHATELRIIKMKLSL